MKSNANSSLTRSSTTNLRKLVLAALFVSLSLVLKMVFEIYITESLRFNFVNVPIILSGMLLGPVWGFATGCVSDIANYLIKPGGAFMPLLTIASGLVGLIPGLIFRLDRDDKKSKLNYPILNAVVFLILFIGAVFILKLSGAVTLEGGVLLLKGKALSWWFVAFAAAVFVAYAVVIVVLLRRREDKTTVVRADKVLFAVASAEVISSVICNSLILFIMYGSALIAILPVRILKALIMIPIFSLMCFALMNVVRKNKLYKD